MIPRLTAFLLKMRNRHFLIVDVLVFFITPAVALALRTDGPQAALMYGSSLLATTLVFALIKIVVFYCTNLYSLYWRYASVDELGHIGVAAFVVLIGQTVAFFELLRPTGWVAPDFPRSIPIIEALLALLYVGCFRYSVRLAERLNQRIYDRRSAKRVLVMGAGHAGVAIVKEMQSDPRLGLHPIGFVDDDLEKHHATIQGVYVLGNRQRIPELIQKTGADLMVVAMPTASGKAIREIVDLCEQAGVPTKIIPGIYELLNGKVSVSQLRDVQIEDLLRREPIKTDTSAVLELFRGKRVLVTGAGGSIGSELCRQVLCREPSELILLGHGENSIFAIHNELLKLVHGSQSSTRHSRPSTHTNGHTPVVSKTACELHAVIADIRFPERIQSIFDEYRPQIVVHAAAHKHVPLMEVNMPEAITNNVMGTRNLLDASLAVDVERFIMISTDKAVNPTSIMGASKRAAELLVHQTAELARKSYVAVRFGNVLGSRGSVMLTFKQQIAAGGPVTVTHPDMQRFFMTIPEAVQLALQAAALGHGGEVFTLDMGEPVKIVDLARDIIELSGLEVGRDIDIVFTGVRPGEKLYEELFVEGERFERTIHQKIFIAHNASTFVPPFLNQSIVALQIAAETNDKANILSIFRELIPQFQHPEILEEPAWRRESLRVRTVGAEAA
jgi:FlaA1/EpsC-like NDP-sugar epimerase